MNITTREWVDDLIGYVLNTDRLDKELSESRVNANFDAAELLELGVTEHQIEDAIQYLDKETSRLSREIERHSQRYQQILDKADGVRESKLRELKKKANRQLQAEKAKRKNHKLLSRKLAVLEELFHKVNQFKVQHQFEHEHGDVFDEMEASELGQAVDTLNEKQFEMEQKIEDTSRELDMIDDDGLEGPIYPEVEEDMAEKKLRDIEDGMGGFGSELFEDDDEFEVNLQEEH